MKDVGREMAAKGASRWLVKEFRREMLAKGDETVQSDN
jgi:hypothetical protein